MTPCYARVARLLAEGLDTRQIAAQLGITRLSVKTYIKRAAAKLPGPQRPQIKLVQWYMSP